eukprot:TRINITY_DN65163_c0_g1_i1.p2 TRINITY_DN65163_c0_g1~~TRINITY_DN65163_c0_g1_i1.p2  ORF type:complete len:158 (+),score=56.86 TRINITY_DN65163_c0_g1_i1:66-476(+)
MTLSYIPRAAAADPTVREPALSADYGSVGKYYTQHGVPPGCLPIAAEVELAQLPEEPSGHSLNGLRGTVVGYAQAGDGEFCMHVRLPGSTWPFGGTPVALRPRNVVEVQQVRPGSLEAISASPPRLRAGGLLKAEQ